MDFIRIGSLEKVMIDQIFKTQLLRPCDSERYGGMRIANVLSEVDVVPQPKTLEELITNHATAQNGNFSRSRVRKVRLTWKYELAFHFNQQCKRQKTGIPDHAVAL